MTRLRKLRDWFVELKIYLARVAAYLSIANFLMIILIFLNTTLWEYQPIQSLFSSKKIFILVGFAVIAVIFAILAYVDTKYNIWRTETERMLIPNRNPQLIPVAFQCAKMLGDLKKQDRDTKEIEAYLDDLFKRCNMTGEFEFFKKKTA